MLREAGTVLLPHRKWVGVWVACTAVSPRSLPLGVFREKERLRLSNRNSILTGLKTISGEVYGHDERPNTL